MTAYELYQHARLDEAIETAGRRVKSAPTDVDARLLLCDLLCHDNQFERADRHLDVLLQQDAGLAAGIGLYRQLIRAAAARSDVFESGRLPEFADGVTDVLALHLRATLALREGAAGEASELLRQAEEIRPRASGECDGESFTDFRDLDDRTASFLEVLTSTGKYYWVGWERVQSLEFRPVKYLRDLLWRQTDLAFRGGPDALVYVPVLYYGSHRHQNPEVRVGRRTEWDQVAGGPVAGAGQRMLLVGDGDKSILSIRKISFSAIGASSAPGQPA